MLLTVQSESDRQQPSLANDSPLSKYNCSHCGYLIYGPYQSESCGHWFCKVCADEIKDSTEKVFCKKVEGKDACLIQIVPLEEEDAEPFFRDRFVEKEIKSLSVACNRKSCGWTGTLADVAQHEEEVEENYSDDSSLCAGAACDGCRQQLQEQQQKIQHLESMLQQVMTELQGLKVSQDASVDFSSSLAFKRNLRWQNDLENTDLFRKGSRRSLW